MTPAEWRDLEQAGHGAGLDQIGVTSARGWTSARSVLEARRADGLAGGMEFTYRNPARSTDPTRVLGAACSIVVGSRSYVQRVPEPPPDFAAARVARYATADHYGRLRAGLEVIATGLRGLGFRAVVLADDNSLVDREAAWRAGLGWYGRNSLLLQPGRGSWSVLGAVVTDARVPRAAPPVPDGCGTCARCVPACPTGAIGADGRVDARRCLAWLLQAPGTFPEDYRAALGDRVYGCDDCQDVCPPNRVELTRRVRAGDLVTETEPGVWLDAVRLLHLDDAALLAIVDRWYLPNRDVSVVRRNLLVVLGNSGPEVRPGVVGVLDEYANGDDSLLAEHARWARSRLAHAAGDGPVRNNRSP